MKPFNSRSRQGSAIIITVLVVLLGFILYSFFQSYIDGMYNQTDHRYTAQSMTKVSGAINQYFERNGVYPHSLEVLAYPRNGQPALISGETLFIPGYLYDYRRNAETFELRAVPEEQTGYFYFTDPTQTIRVNKDAPADVESDLLKL